MKSFFNLIFILIFALGLSCSRGLDGSVSSPAKNLTPTKEVTPPVIVLNGENKEVKQNVFELLTNESNKSLKVSLPDGWVKQQVFEKEGEGKTTTFTNGLSGYDEKYFIVFESILSDPSVIIDNLFESFKGFCTVSLGGNVEFSPTKVIKDKKSGLVFHAALGIEKTQPSIFIAASTKYSDKTSFSFICYENDKDFKTCGKIFESLRKN